MPGYQAFDHAPHFCTLTVADWFPLFIESRYSDCLLECLQFCRRNKGLRLHAYVIMPNHLHLIASAQIGLHPVMRDFKRFTSRTIHNLLVEDHRERILRWFETAAEPARQSRGEWTLWEPGFHPQVIYSQEVFLQKAEYIHNNPVRKGLVCCPEHWRNSSASLYADSLENQRELDSIDAWE